ncbi:(2Fe-2S)-binding protein [Pandoraea fibrosis]|uniref:(2Fe-2S)-binding protein n=1 Tax=Pandoraea fibrosis TaxID=1891094 RepID=A0ABX6HRK2_9BURK|nr:(2Fe-2S)-binding protein [Pandoraea fibrosis]QHE92912.1 (2Fe-2S)-binding protein [Pandoraea fibrosis]QHF13531.1 (2Fe-2S)-binding protein [Pandoraea fibrosis]
MSRSSHSSQDLRAPGHPQLARVAETSRPTVTFYLDGEPAQALAGDTLLTAILTHQRHVRISEFSGTPRAGFCLIGACQDCWVRCESGPSGPSAGGDAQLSRLRACSTQVQDGMRILTRAAETHEVHGGSHD